MLKKLIVDCPSWFARGRVASIFCAGALLPVFVSIAAHATDYIPLMSFDGSREVGRMFRADGSAPDKAQAERDRQTCINDPREIPSTIVDRITVLSKSDRQAAALELAKAIIPCMARKGWRTEILGANSGPDRPTIAVVDAVLDKLSVSLPQEMDDYSDLVGVKRERTDIIYTVRVRPKAQATADEAREFIAKDPRAAEVMNKSLIKQRVCEPELNIFLKQGFAVVYAFFDAKGLVWQARVTASDC